VCGDVRSKRLAAERRIVRERTEKVRGGWEVREKESTRERRRMAGEREEKQRREWDGEREWEKVLFRFWRGRDTHGLHALEHMSIAWTKRGTCDFLRLGHVLRERGQMAFIHWNT
jgi:hypothetical protein